MSKKRRTKKKVKTGRDKSKRPISLEERAERYLKSYANFYKEIAKSPGYRKGSRHLQLGEQIKLKNHRVAHWHFTKAAQESKLPLSALSAHINLKFGYFLLQSKVGSQLANARSAASEFENALKSPKLQRSHVAHHQALLGLALSLGAIYHITKDEGDFERASKCYTAIYNLEERMKMRLGLTAPGLDISYAIFLTGRSVNTGAEGYLKEAQRVLENSLRDSYWTVRGKAYKSSWDSFEAKRKLQFQLATTELYNIDDRIAQNGLDRLERMVTKEAESSFGANLTLAALILTNQSDSRKKVAREFLEIRVPINTPGFVCARHSCLCSQAGLPELARASFDKAFKACFDVRKSARTDHEAVLSILPVQEAALEFCWQFCSQLNPLEVFLTLEKITGSNIEDFRFQNIWLPRNESGIALHKEIGELRQLSSDLARLGGEMEVAECNSLDNAEKFHELAEPQINSISQRLEHYPDIQKLVDRPQLDSSNLNEAAEGLPVMLSDQIFELRDLSPQYDQSVSKVLQPLVLHDLRDLIATFPDRLFLRIEAGQGKAVGASAYVKEGEVRCLADRLDSNVIEEISSTVANGQVPSNALLRRLDLSALIPADAPRKLIVILGRDATRLPLLALTAGGQQLLDRFDEIVQLPFIGFLTRKPDCYEDRDGLLTVAPSGTQFGQAVAETQNRGVILSGSKAKEELVKSESKRADVISFYTHGLVDVQCGQYGMGLSDGCYWDIGEFGLDTFFGAERVELWACRTATQEPVSTLVPNDASELYGLDGLFLCLGARTTIGSLWPIPELSTYFIRRQYLKFLENMRAPTALLSAQRWWIRSFIPCLRDNLSKLSIGDALEETAHSFDMPLDVGASLAKLGPVRRGETSLSKEKFIDYFSSPEAWCGFRFLGEPEYVNWVSQE